MLMRGDMNKMIENVNKVLEGAFKRLDALEARLMELEGTDTSAPKPRGRPKGSKNKPREANIALAA